jgi:hypothetical protein
VPVAIARTVNVSTDFAAPSFAPINVAPATSLATRDNARW